MKISQITSIIFLLFIGFAFSSCSSDDDNAIVNQGPDAFSLIQVPDGSVDVKLKPTFTWSAAASPDDSDITYDVFLDTNNPPTTKIASEIHVPITELENNLDYGTVYYWKVVAKNNQGSTESKIAFFQVWNPSSADQLVGSKWSVVKITHPTKPYENNVCTKLSTFEFSEDGTLHSIIWAGSGKCEVVYDDEDPYEFFTDTKLKISSTRINPYEYEILTLNPNSLVLERTNGFVYTFEPFE